MDIEIRTISEGELDAFFRATESAFSSVPSDDALARERTLAEPDPRVHAFAVRESVGTAGAYTMPMTLRGGETEVGFVTAVGVRQTHRRRGVNTELMRRQLDDARRRGEVAAAL